MHALLQGQHLAAGRAQSAWGAGQDKGSLETFDVHAGGCCQARWEAGIQPKAGAGSQAPTSARQRGQVTGESAGDALHNSRAHDTHTAWRQPAAATNAQLLAAGPALEGPWAEPSPKQTGHRRAAGCVKGSERRRRLARAEGRCRLCCTCCACCAASCSNSALSLLFRALAASDAREGIGHGDSSSCTQEKKKKCRALE